MQTRSIDVEPKDLERAIDALSGAAQALRLTLFERISYRALMICADVILVGFAVFAVFVGVAVLEWISDFGWLLAILAVIVFIIGLASIIGIFSLVLNIPLFVRAFRERRRLDELGLASLSTSLWKESRRSRWVGRVRSVLLIAVTVAFALAFAFSAPTMTGRNDETIFGLFYAAMAAMLFSARFLRHQRERMELAASAQELRKALQSLRRKHAGAGELVSVPSELMERTAQIETARIVQERKEAVLQSVERRPQGYSVSFDSSVAEQRATLPIDDREELEDLVARLSTEGAKLEAQAEGAAEGNSLRRVARSDRLEIEYVMDPASRNLAVTAMRHGGDESRPVTTEGRHAS